jgi:hypothetical protein
VLVIVAFGWMHTAVMRLNRRVSEQLA